MCSKLLEQHKKYCSPNFLVSIITSNHCWNHSSIFLWHTASTVSDTCPSWMHIFSVWQNNAEELRAERLRRATERLRSPVVFNKDSAVRKTQLKSFSQYVESRPGGWIMQHKHTHNAYSIYLGRYVCTQQHLTHIHLIHTWDILMSCWFTCSLAVVWNQLCEEGLPLPLLLLTTVQLTNRSQVPH